MGFNFGAFLGGAADQIVKDLDEQEKEVKLRTRTILDRQIAETATNRKEYKANKKKVTEQLNALIPLLGDDKNAIAKARSIVAGGDNHFNFMFNTLQKHALNGGDASTIYKYTPNKDEVGFKNVAQATDSLVQMANVPAPTFGTQTDNMFGLSMGNVYQKARKQFEEAGVLDPEQKGDLLPATYGTGQLDLGALSQDAKSLDQLEANAFRDRGKAKPGTPEYDAANAKLEEIKKYKTESSVNYQIAKLTAETKDKPSLSGYTTIHTKGLARIQKRYESAQVIFNGKTITDPEEKAKALQEETKQYNKNFIKGLIRNGYDSNAKDLISSTPELAELENEVVNEMEEAIIGKKNKEKQQTAFTNQVNNAKSAGTPSAYLNSLPNKGKNISKEALKQVLKEAYPNEDIDKLLG
tara:strand:+ start:538 stop:1767 length:1230 start_codon:yes stop_codon:yes gene_type:complete